MIVFRACLLGLALVMPLAGIVADEQAYRTDGGNEALPWYKLVDGAFPPSGSAHVISGELISVDHIQRRGMLRQDRTGDQRTDDYDLPLSFSLLPYGSVQYHGARRNCATFPSERTCMVSFMRPKKTANRSSRKR